MIVVVTGRSKFSVLSGWLLTMGETTGGVNEGRGENLGVAEARAGRGWIVVGTRAVAMLVDCLVSSPVAPWCS